MQVTTSRVYHVHISRGCNPLASSQTSTRASRKFFAWSWHHRVIITILEHYTFPANPLAKQRSTSQNPSFWVSSRALTTVPPFQMKTLKAEKNIVLSRPGHLLVTGQVVCGKGLVAQEEQTHPLRLQPMVTLKNLAYWDSTGIATKPHAQIHLK